MYIANDGMTKRVWFILDTEKRVYQTVDLGSTLYGAVLTLCVSRKVSMGVSSNIKLAPMR